MMAQYLSMTEVAVRYRISKSTCYRWIDDPKICFPKPLKVGHRILWRDEDLAAFDARIANT